MDAAIIDAIGGTSGYDISWTGPTVDGSIYSGDPLELKLSMKETHTINSFPSGTYDITVTDQNGCSFTYQMLL